MEFLSYNLRVVILQMQQNIYLFLLYCVFCDFTCKALEPCCEETKSIRRIVVTPSILANASLIVGSAQQFGKQTFSFAGWRDEDEPHRKTISRKP